MSVRGLLGEGQLKRSQRDRLRRALAAGPWSWPWDDDELVRRGADLVDVPPADPPIGCVALVTAVVRRERLVGGGLWHQPRSPDRTHARPLGSEARLAWKNAVAALPRALPMLTRLPLGWDREPSSLERFAFEFAPRESSRLNPVVDGPSFGLGFLLVLASKLMNHPVSGAVIASAAIDPSGRLGPVAGVEWKLRVISAWAPGVTTVLVAREQAKAWREEVSRQRLALRVQGYLRASDVLEDLFGEAVREHVAGMDEGARSHFVKRMFDQANTDAAYLVDWLPVDRVTQHALRGWGDRLDIYDRWRLRYANAVAARHENRHVQLDMPPAGFLAPPNLHPPTALKVVAHLVQHSADVGSPPGPNVLAMADAWISAHPSDVRAQRIIGAKGRYLSRHGEFGRALDLQRQVARYFAEIGEWGEVSYQLSEWYRLAGCLQGEVGLEVLAEADDFIDFHRPFEQADAGRPFVQLARARSQVQLGSADAESQRTLEELSTTLGRHIHLRYSAVRWHIQWLRTQDERAAAREVLADLEAATKGDPAADQASWFLCLARLDAALADGDPEEAKARVLELSESFGPIVAALQAVDPDPGFVALAFPY